MRLQGRCVDSDEEADVEVHVHAEERHNVPLVPAQLPHDALT